MINHDLGHVHLIKDFKFIDGIFELALAARERNYLVIIITNQAGIGRGYYTEGDFYKLMNWVDISFRKMNCKIDDVYFCPFHPLQGLGKYKKNSNFRKPNPGMILQAEIDHNIDLNKSILIGDNESDIEAGKSAKVQTNILLKNGKLLKNIEGSIRINHLTEAISFL